RFSDAGIAAEERHAAEDRAAAKNTIELADARGDARGLIDVHVLHRLRRALRLGGARSGRRSAAPGQRFLDERVPRAARRTAPDPAREERAARLTDELGVVLRHQSRL